MKKSLLILVLLGYLPVAYGQESLKKEMDKQRQHNGIPFVLPGNRTRDVVPEEKPVQHSRKLSGTAGMENYAKTVCAAFMPSTDIPVFRPATYSYGMLILHSPSKPQTGLGFKQL